MCNSATSCANVGMWRKRGMSGIEGGSVRFVVIISFDRRSTLIKKKKKKKKKHPPLQAIQPLFFHFKVCKCSNKVDQ